MSRRAEPPGEVLEVAPDQLKQAVEGLHGCKARLREVVPVLERFRGATVWEGVVHVFDLDGHPTASVAYAWSARVEGSARRKFYAVLGAPGIDSARAAVQAAVVSDAKVAR